jgi:hypothetical protein
MLLESIKTLLRFFGTLEMVYFNAVGEWGSNSTKIPNKSLVKIS